MSAENVEIKVSDGVAPSISNKLKGIASDARDAHNAVKLLQEQLNALNLSGLSRLNSELSKNQRASDLAAMSSQKLATEQQRTFLATQKLATEQQRTATASQRLNTEQSKTAITAQRLATEQQRTAIATANAANANSRAELAAFRLSTAQQKLQNSTTNVTGALGRYTIALASAVGASVSAAGILQLADAYVVLQNKLVNVTENQNQVNLLVGRVGEIAIETRSNLESTAQAFARFDRSLKAMGKSQEDTLRMTETINKALLLSGATAQEASSALLQLSQGFNAGKLMGDEFRAVSENMPVALDAIAKALDVPVNQLKKLSSEGKITSKVLFEAFQIIQKEVDEKFGKTTVTIGQGLEVLRTQAILFFGELNNSIGFTTGIANAMLWLGENLDTVAIVLATTAGVLLAVFTPAIVGATVAVGAFTLALVTNPLILLVASISAATAAIVIFGDEIKVSEDGLISLKDVFRTAFEFMGESASATASLFGDVWQTATYFVGEKILDWYEGSHEILGLFMAAAKSSANFTIGAFVGAYNAILVVWNNFPSAMEALFVAVANLSATSVENVVNSWQTGLRSIAQKVSEVAPFAGTLLGVGLENSTLRLPRVEASASGKQAGKDFKDAFNSAMGVDYVGKTIDGFNDRLRQVSENRRALEAKNAGASLRGAGKNTLADEVDEKKAKAAKKAAEEAARAAERRALALSKVNAELDNELARMNMLKPARDAQAKFDQIEEQLLGKKIKLTDQEASSIKSKIAAIQQATQVQQYFDSIYEEYIANERDYSNIKTAANKLLDMGAISQKAYNETLIKARENYENAKDPMLEYNKNLQDQLNLAMMLPKNSEIESQLMQLKNTLLTKGIELSEDELSVEREKLKLIQDQTNAYSARNQIYSETQGALNGMIDKQRGLNLAYQDGLINIDDFKNRSVELGIEMANLKLQMGDATFLDGAIASLGSVLSGYEGLQKGLSDSFGSFFTQFTDGFANSIGQAIVYGDNLKESLHQVSQQIVADLIGALVKLGVQWLINAALSQTIGASAAAGQIAIASVTGSAIAAAYAPAAAMVSLATMGQNSVPAMLGMSATTSMSQGLAMSGLKGFKNGGYTGDVGVNEIVGVTHGKEYNFTAQQTASLGKENLEALANGAATIQRNSESYVSTATASSNQSTQAFIVQPNIVVNTLPGQSATTSTDANGNITIDIVDKYVSEALGNPNSKASRSLKSNYAVQRK